MLIEMKMTSPASNGENYLCISAPVFILGYQVFYMDGLFLPCLIPVPYSHACGLHQSSLWEEKEVEVVAVCIKVDSAFQLPWNFSGYSLFMTP